MSLNRAEQMVDTYVQANADERNFWKEKVYALASKEKDHHTAAGFLEPELWRYFEERAAVVEPFRGFAEKEGTKKISMRNLAEYWIRIWGPVQAKRNKGKSRPPVVPY